MKLSFSLEMRDGGETPKRSLTIIRLLPAMPVPRGEALPSTSTGLDGDGGEVSTEPVVVDVIGDKVGLGTTRGVGGVEPEARAARLARSVELIWAMATERNWRTSPDDVMEGLDEVLEVDVIGGGEERLSAAVEAAGEYGW